MNRTGIAMITIGVLLPSIGFGVSMMGAEFPWLREWLLVETSFSSLSREWFIFYASTETGIVLCLAGSFIISQRWVEKVTEIVLGFVGFGVAPLGANRIFIFGMSICAMVVVHFIVIWVDIVWHGFSPEVFSMLLIRNRIFA